MKNLKNILFTGGLFALVIVGLVLISRPGASTKSNSGAGKDSGLVAVENSYDFGTISMAAGKVSYNFKIQNTTSESITVSKLYTSCMCTEATLMVGPEKQGPFGMPGHGFTPRINQQLNPGQEAIIEAVFDPAAHGPAGVGVIERAVVVETAAGGKLQLDIKAKVIP